MTVAREGAHLSIYNNSGCLTSLGHLGIRIPFINYQFGGFLVTKLFLSLQTPLEYTWIRSPRGEHDQLLSAGKKTIGENT